jgi:hypothetical protein
MGLLDSIKGQFLDIIEYVDNSGERVVKKYIRSNGDNNEIKTGARVIVRPSQAAVFFKHGQFADILKEGTHKLNTQNLPILSTLMAFPYMFNSPIKADLYFINLKQFVGYNWLTKAPIIVRDKEFKMIRITAFGKFAFKIDNVEKFVREILGTQRKFDTIEILDYLNSFIVEAFTTVIGELNIPIIDLYTQYSELSRIVQNRANVKSKDIGIVFSNINVENIGLPKEVEKYIDEQSAIGMATQDMEEFMQYQSVRAMRDAAKQKGGLAGIGVGFSVGKKITDIITDTPTSTKKIKCENCGNLNKKGTKFWSECGNEFEKKDKIVEEKEIKKQEKEVQEKVDNSTKFEKLREYKKLLDEGILSKEEYEIIKKELL